MSSLAFAAPSCCVRICTCKELTCGWFECLLFLGCCCTRCLVLACALGSLGHWFDAGWPARGRPCHFLLFGHCSGKFGDSWCIVLMKLIESSICCSVLMDGVHTVRDVHSTQHRRALTHNTSASAVQWSVFSRCCGSVQCNGPECFCVFLPCSRPTAFASFLHLGRVSFQTES